MYSPQSLHRWGITHSESMERLAYSQAIKGISSRYVNMTSPAEHDLTLSEADSSKEKVQVFGILRLQEEKSGVGDKANSSSTMRGGAGGGGDGRWQAPIFALARKASETISGSIHVLPKVSEHRTSLPGDWTVQDPMAMERANLLNMAKLSIKGLIESALSFGRTLDSDYPPLQQFFVVMEHCLKHGLRAAEISASVRDLPGLKTPLGRARAWLRLALMQKRLADYLRLLITRKDLLSDFYENSALMLEEEGAVIVGLLVGLNVIDANLCVGVIDFSMYLKNDIDDYRSEERNSQIASILDQKNYVEELNRQLNSTVHGLQGRVDSLEKSNSKLIEELAIAKNNIIKLQEENQQLRSENSLILMKTQTTFRGNPRRCVSGERYIQTVTSGFGRDVQRGPKATEGRVSTQTGCGN
ncbi:hypothetical protein FQN60_010805 [Etheostoma spectabile]|uniref:RUN domain-containing protein n=1 Tax=Etheostoma spectabile TaxID=54343 RepID=A0A5J5DQ00_9PERO|nr:hypothetical protein FQN60_010805 [Etheostoma spectabile]